jgi:restriction system protein
MSTQGQIRVTYTRRGLQRFELEISHTGLNRYQVVRGNSRHEVEQKARAKMVQWDEIWARKVRAQSLEDEKRLAAKRIEDKKQIAAERTEEAQEALSALDHVLAHALGVNSTVDWKALKDYSDYSDPKPEKLVPPEIPPEPKRSDTKYKIRVGFFDALLDEIFTSRRIERKKKMGDRFKRDHQQWRAAREEAIALYNRSEAEYKTALSAWEVKREEYLKKRDRRNAAVEEFKKKYMGGDPKAVIYYCDLVLSRSEYPDFAPQSYELDYNPNNKVLIVDYQLPPVSSIPILKEVQYVQTRDEFVEKQISTAELNRLYDDLLYQIALRTVHELYQADQADTLAAIAFNGYVDSVDPATGRETHACVLSLLVSKEEFRSINLVNVEPKACFRKLKGVGSSKLHSLTPVAPILEMKREDKRFVEPYAVADSLQEGYNLATMDWQDFEHLVRELFEKEFTESGGEVKVTRASRDGGIDAVVFDPDPLRGGKTVIQAKRYTHTVSVSAVRDLYGAVINEGANKGILVTTSDYGPDAYEFARDKPLVLLNGSNLLYLLEKHGHKARIDLAEARKMLAEDSQGSSQ